MVLVTIPGRRRANDSGVHLPYVTRPVPEYVSAFVMPKCTDTEAADRTPFAHSRDDRCPVHPGSNHGRSVHAKWYEARERYAKAPGIDPERDAGLLGEMLRYVTADNPPAALKPRTVAKRLDRATRLALVGVSFALTWLIAIICVAVNFW